MNAPYNPFLCLFQDNTANLRRFSPLPPFYSFYPLYRPFSMHILIQTLHIITLSAHVGSTSVTERYRSEDTINYAALCQKMIVLRYTTSLFPSFSQSETAISLFAELSPFPLALLAIIFCPAPSFRALPSAFFVFPLPLAASLLRPLPMLFLVALFMFVMFFNIIFLTQNDLFCPPARNPSLCLRLPLSRTCTCTSLSTPRLAPPFPPFLHLALHHPSLFPPLFLLSFSFASSRLCFPIAFSPPLQNCARGFLRFLFVLFPSSITLLPLPVRDVALTQPNFLFTFLFSFSLSPHFFCV